VRAVALLLTVGVLLGVGGRASALGAGSDTAVGVVGIVIAGAGDMVALRNAAHVVGVACSQDASEIRIDLVELTLDSRGGVTYTSGRTGPQR
jgi:hypothetical protein